MTNTLSIVFDDAEGALVRTLGLIERRGFGIATVSAHNTPDEGCREMTVAVEARSGERSVDVLSRQLERLVGVRRVCVHHQAVVLTQAMAS